MFKDETGEIVPAIVTEEIWDQANAVLKKRSEDVKARQGISNHANLLTGKLYCTHCGAAYYRRDTVDRSGNKNSKWVCSGKIKNGSDSCPSFAVYESEIKPLLLEVLRDTEADAKAQIERYMELYTSLAGSGGITEQIEEQEQIIELAEKKKQKLLQLAATGEMSDRDFLSMNKQCTAEIDTARELLSELYAQRESADDLKKHLDTIRQVLKEAERDAVKGVVNKDFVDKFIDRIFATMVDETTMQLQIKIFTGEVTEKYLANLRVRAGSIIGVSKKPYENAVAAMAVADDSCTGHTFKNKCPMRTMNFVRNDRTAFGHKQAIMYIMSITV